MILAVVVVVVAGDAGDSFPTACASGSGALATSEDCGSSDGAFRCVVVVAVVVGSSDGSGSGMRPRRVTHRVLCCRRSVDGVGG